MWKLELFGTGDVGITIGTLDAFHLLSVMSAALSSPFGQLLLLVTDGSRNRLRIK